MRRPTTLLLLGLVHLVPAPALQLPADAQRTLIHPGAWSFRIRRPAGPWAIDGFLWDRHEPRLRLDATHAWGKIHSLEPTSRQVVRLTTPDQRAIAAVNGDFYIMAGPGQGAGIGVLVRDGELIGCTARDSEGQIAGGGRPALVVGPAGELTIAACTTRLRAVVDGQWIDIMRLNNSRGPNCLTLYTDAWGPRTNTSRDGVELVLRSAQKLRPNGTLLAEVTAVKDGEGDTALQPGVLVLSGSGKFAPLLRTAKVGSTIELHLETQPLVPMRSALGGYPILIAGGKLLIAAEAKQPRHPRTAIGFDANHVVALTVDGRQPGHSIGMTMTEVMKLMREFGCTDALNFDGGGSTTCWVRGRVLNRTSDGPERHVANALALVSQGPLGEPAMILFDPPGPVCLTPGASLVADCRVSDALLNPLPGNTPVAVAVEGDIGSWSRRTFTAADHAGRGRLVARAGGVSGALAVTVVEQVATLECSPSVIEALPGETVTISVAGADGHGAPVLLDPAGLRWQVTAGTGQLAGAKFIAGPEGRSGSVTVSGFGARAVIPVRVAAPALLEDFHAGLGGTFAGIPETVTGRLERVTDQGPPFARLSYHLGDEPRTRAAYLRLDRRLGAALALRARVRGDGQAVWLRAAVTDGNGTRESYTLYQGVLSREWSTVQAALPKGLKQPVTWESVYQATLAGGPTKDGVLDWQRLEVLRVGAGE